MKQTLSLVSLLFLLAACSDELEAEYPVDLEQRRVNERGKITGEGFVLGGDDDSGSGGGVIGVNSYLWRATLDTVADLPLASADPFGGVILTDWYEPPETPGERFKLNILMLGKTLRVDALKVTVFRQAYQQDSGQWKDVDTNPETSRKIENAILTRARALRSREAVEE